MRNLFYLIILTVITGCSYSSSRSGVLDEARRLIQSDPSVALSKLNDVDVSEFQDSATMARWALLYSEAMLANNLAAPTDSIINIAVDYYNAHNNHDALQKALRIKALSQATDNKNELATALYLQKEKEFMLYKERTERKQIVYIGLVVFLIAVGIIVWMRQSLKIKSAQNDALMAEAFMLNECIESKTGDLSRLEATLHRLLENRFSLIDSLCQTYYESQGTKTERKAIIDKVKSVIESVRTDSFPRMEQAVNDCRDDILIKVKNTMPAIKAEDYQLLVYLASGLSTRTISLLLGESVDVIYKRKSRLKSRLKESVESVCPDIMTVF